MSYLGSNDHIPYDSCPEPELTWEQYRLSCAAQINKDLPDALVKVLIDSCMPMSRWGRISDLMVQSVKYGRENP